MNKFCAGLFAGVLSCAFAWGFPATGQTEKVLYSFGGGQPGVGLIDVNGTLYGTTYENGGTLYSLDKKTRKYSMLWYFDPRKGKADGYNPAAPVIEVNGVLYGTTMSGGAYCRVISGCGTVFAFDLKTQTESVLYSFGAKKADGATPMAGLINVRGRLYGTTFGGGANNGGTVFSINLNTGNEKVLYSFCSRQNCSDGREPVASLIDVKGTLYGTTRNGGISNYGTAFALEPTTGEETVLHAFGGGADGESPVASLTYANSTLYGTTPAGGRPTTGSQDAGCGILFSLDANTGQETLLHTFGKAADGCGPEGNLTDMSGMLYGTTLLGGTSLSCGSYGCGTVFAFNPQTTTASVIYSFCSRQNCTDGADPVAGLTAKRGKLYSTTGSGGSAYYYGTIFEVTP